MAPAGPNLQASQPGKAKKLKPTVYICARRQLNDVCRFDKCMYPSQHGMSAAQTLTYMYVNNEFVTNMSVPVCSWYVHVYIGQCVYILVYTCKYTYEQCTYMFILPFVCTMYVHCSYMYVQFPNCMYMDRILIFMYRGAT